MLLKSQKHILVTHRKLSVVIHVYKRWKVKIFNLCLESLQKATSGHRLVKEIIGYN